MGRRMLIRIIIKCARLSLCVVLGVVLGLAIPMTLERFTPGYKYYTDIGE